jgi:hypothetical protein
MTKPTGRPPGRPRHPVPHVRLHVYTEKYAAEWLVARAAQLGITPGQLIAYLVDRAALELP